METPSKADVFDLFYGKQIVTRAGGGTAKTKMARLYPGYVEIESMRARVQEDANLLKYFENLRTRKSGLAPPPRPEEAE
jgi:hypothetical protein